MSNHAGAEWLKMFLNSNGKKYERKLSEFGEQVADLLGELFQGIYHMNVTSLMKAEWESNRYIAVTTSTTLSTFDTSDLTRLVFLAHHLCIRVEVEAIARGYLRLIFTKRINRNGKFFERHPTLDNAVESFKKYVSLPEFEEQVTTE